MADPTVPTTRGAYGQPEQSVPDTDPNALLQAARAKYGDNSVQVMRLRQRLNFLNAPSQQLAAALLRTS